MTADEQAEFRKILLAHAQTLAVCEACATTTRDLALEVRRGGAPSPEALTETAAEAERVLGDVGRVREEVERLLRVVR
ncbi:MAG: hypothetical protein AB7G23_17300 [Vicinamibacterales bacterium]